MHILRNLTIYYAFFGLSKLFLIFETKNISLSLHPILRFKAISLYSCVRPSVPYYSVSSEHLLSVTKIYVYAVCEIDMKSKQTLILLFTFKHKRKFPFKAVNFPLNDKEMIDAFSHKRGPHKTIASKSNSYIYINL